MRDTEISEILMTVLPVHDVRWRCGCGVEPEVGQDENLWGILTGPVVSVSEQFR